MCEAIHDLVARLKKLHGAVNEVFLSDPLTTELSNGRADVGSAIHDQDGLEFLLYLVVDRLNLVLGLLDNLRKHILLSILRQLPCNDFDKVLDLFIFGLDDSIQEFYLVLLLETALLGRSDVAELLPLLDRDAVLHSAFELLLDVIDFFLCVLQVAVPIFALSAAASLGLGRAG